MPNSTTQKSSARHRAREIALQVLYQYDTALASSAIQALPTGSALAADILRHFDHFQVPADLRAFASELVAGTLGELPQLDQLIEANAKNWKIARMASIDRSLLRMALYEMRHFPDIPRSVTIDEAVELAKQFGAAETPAFVNGILDSIRS